MPKRAGRGKELKNPVANPGACAIGLECSVDPVRPELVFEVKSTNAPALGQIQVDSSTDSHIGEASVCLVVLEIHLSKAHESLPIRNGSKALEFVDRNPRSKQVRILRYVHECVFM